jgi:hypothetical protein
VARVLPALAVRWEQRAALSSATPHLPPPARFAPRIIGGRHLVGTKAEFIAFWRRRVMQLALMAHQYRNGAVGRDVLEKVQGGAPAMQRPRPQGAPWCQGVCRAARRQAWSLTLCTV